MQAATHILFASDHYTVSDYRCGCLYCGTSQTEYNERFSISFVNSGNFYYHAFRQDLDSFNGRVLVSKPGYEYRVSHPGTMPDHCTVLLFSPPFFNELLAEAPAATGWFFGNPDVQSVLVRSAPETEWLHHRLRQAVTQQPVVKLEVDSLLMEILQALLRGLGPAADLAPLSETLKRHHLSTVESAKEFLRQNHGSDVSLAEVATNCHVSVFHFSRLFKSITGYSPHQYLQGVRLKQAELLLQSGLPVTDVAFSAGFGSLDYFSAAFKKRYKLSPLAFRNRRQQKQDF